MSRRDREILRDLTQRYLEICARDVQRERRALWRRHNSLRPTRPPIYVRAFAWSEMPESECHCEDPFYRSFEDFFRYHLFWDSLGDDSIFEPWVTVQATRIVPAEGWGGVWGLPVEWVGSGAPRGSHHWDPPLRDPDDARKLVEPHHRIDEADTERRVSKLHDAVGDLIAINVDRAPAWRMWSGDISTELVQLRGLDTVMLDMVVNPDWLHELLAFMRDGILRAHAEAEEGGDWKLCDHQNQAMPYAEELRDPQPNGPGVKRSDLWYFAAAQELTLVGPDMFHEFMLQYQIPILEPFGLTAYGCCEDLSLKIGYLRRIPNLRRIAVSPMANVAQCAEKIGRDYVVSYRPSPSDMVGYGFDPDRIRRILRRDIDICRDSCFDITLKDVETVQHDPNRVREWVRIARETLDEFGLG